MTGIAGSKPTEDRTSRRRLTARRVREIREGIARGLMESGYSGGEVARILAVSPAAIDRRLARV